MRTMKKTIAFVLAFAMAFATAFSAIGAKTTASAAAGDKLKLSITASVDGSTLKVVPTYTAVDGTSTIAEEGLKYKTDAADAEYGAYPESGITVTNNRATYTFKATAKVGESDTAEESNEVTLFYPGKFGVTLNSDGSFKAVNVNKELQVGIATVKKGTASITNWDTYEPTDVKVVDTPAVGDTPEVAHQEFQASGYITLAPKKDIYVAFRTVDINGDSYSAPIFWEVQKNSAKYKAKIAIDTTEDMAKIKVGDSDWDSAKFKSYSSQLGAAAVVDYDTNDSDDKHKYYIDDKLYNVGGAIQVTPIGQDPSKTNISTVTYLGKDYDIDANHTIQSDAKAVTVKLKKRANAPKVSINYAKSSATIPKATKYRVIQGSDNWGDAYIANSDKKALALTGLNGLVQVYKAATEKALASKVGVSTYAANDAVEYGSNAVSVTYSDGSDLVINNNYKNDVIEYFIGTTAPTSSAKWTKVKAGAKATVKAAKVDKTADLYTRKAANAKNFLIAGAYTPYDYVKAADDNKKTVTISSSKFSNENKTVEITLSASVSGTVKTGSGATLVEESFTNGTITLTAKEAFTTSSTITIELSPESSKEYKVSKNTLVITGLNDNGVKYAD